MTKRIAVDDDGLPAGVPLPGVSGASAARKSAAQVMERLRDA